MDGVRLNDLRAISPDQPWVTSGANEDIVKKFLTTQKEPIFRTLSFISKQVCTVKINGTETLTINPDLGLEMNSRFKYIYSFEIVEAGIDYYFLAGY